MNDIPDLEELVVWTTPAKVSHPLAYVTVNDARRLIEMLREQQEEIKRLKGEFDRLHAAAVGANIWLFSGSDSEGRARAACELNRVICEIRGQCEELAPGQCEELALCEE